METKNRKRAVVYARVSSKEQEKGGFSIPAQLSLLNEYAKKHSLVVKKVFKEAETAKKAGRTEFNKMIEFIKSSDVDVVLVEKN